MTTYVIDNQIQSVTLKRAAGLVEPYAGAVQATENTLTGINWHTKCPWQITLSVDAVKKLKIFYGSNYDTEFRAHMRASASRLKDVSNVSQAYRFTVKRKNRDQVGWFADEMETLLQGDVFDFNGEDYSVSYSMDWRLTEGKQRILELSAGDTYIPNVMSTSRPAFAGQMEWENDCREVCVKFMPADFYGEYNKWQNGMHIQTTEAGNFTINKRGLGKNYIVLTVAGVTSDGTALAAGRPYTLASNSLVLAAQDNYILHINQV